MLQDYKEWSVAHELASNSYKTNWETNDKKILMLQSRNGWSVAYVLAHLHPTWTTSDPEILSLANKNG